MSSGASAASAAHIDELEEYNLKDLPSFVAVRFVKMLERSNTDPLLNMTNLGISDHQVGSIIEHIGNTTWTKVWLSYNKISDTGFIRLIEALKERGATKFIEDLSVASNQLSDSSISVAVAAFESQEKRLRSLDLAHNKKVSDASVAPLSRLLATAPQLRKLSLLGTSLSDIGCMALCDSIKSSPLYELRLSSPLLTEACFEALLDACRNSCLGVCVVDGPKISASERLRALRQFMEMKGSRHVTILTALASVHVLARIGNKSSFRLFPPELLPDLASMLFSL
jgi:hypothetical protein